jgi:hypothetical protein
MAGVVERPEQMGWSGVLKELVFFKQWERRAARAVASARGSQHPDALWLAALFPPDGDVTREDLRHLMLRQGNDPRALFLAWTVSGEREEKDDRDSKLLQRSAEMGFALAQKMYARAAFAPGDWRWYHWLARGMQEDKYLEWDFCTNVFARVPWFAVGEQGRILHIAAPAFRSRSNTLHVADVYKEDLRRVLELHDSMLGRARRAIDCWSMAARRRGVVKDMRVTIAKMAWAEAWQWGEKN